MSPDLFFSTVLLTNLGPDSPVVWILAVLSMLGVPWPPAPMVALLTVSLYLSTGIFALVAWSRAVREP